MRGMTQQFSLSVIRLSGAATRLVLQNLASFTSQLLFLSYLKVVVGHVVLLYRCSLPLLKSRNSGVVLAVCTAHYYCSSRTGSTMNQIAKAMVRILRNRREIQFVVLDAIR